MIKGNSDTLYGLDFVREAFSDQSNVEYIKRHGITLQNLESGRVVLRMQALSEHINTVGVVQGGFLSMLGDTAAGFAVRSNLPAEKTSIGTNLQYEFTRAVHAGEFLTATGTLAQGKGRMPLAEAEIRNENGDLVAKGSARFQVTESKESLPEESPLDHLR